MSQTREELLLIDFRGEAPLVRIKREFDGFPAGTLGCITGVRGIYLTVRLAGMKGGESLMVANELESV